MVGDGSYLMMNSELATSVMLGQKLTIVLLDNRGYGCINRLQRATGGESFNNLLQHTNHVTLPDIDFAAHAASLGAQAIKVTGIGELEDAPEEGAQRRAHHRHRHRHRSAALHRCGRPLVGCGGAGSLGARAGERPPARITKMRSRAQRVGD